MQTNMSPFSFILTLMCAHLRIVSNNVYAAPRAMSGPIEIATLNVMPSKIPQKAAKTKKKSLKTF